MREPTMRSRRTRSSDPVSLVIVTVYPVLARTAVRAFSAASFEPNASASTVGSFDVASSMIT